MKLLAFLCVCEVALAGVPSAEEMGAGTGGLGAWHVPSARLGSPGLLRLSATAEYFFQNPFPVLAASHSRTAGTLALSWVPLHFLETHFSFNASSNFNTSSSPRLLQSMGDLSLGVKLTRPLAKGVYAGFDVTGFYFPGAGNFDVRNGAVGLASSVLTSWDLREAGTSLPLRWHFNVGAAIDNTPRLAQGLDINSAEEFAFQITRYPHLFARTGLEGRLGPLVPFLEYSLEVPLIIGRSPLTEPDGDTASIRSVARHRVTPGLKWRAFQTVTFMTAADFGLTSSFAKGWPATPRWNVFVGASLAFGQQPRVAEKPTTGNVEGTVVDGTTGMAIENAIVTFDVAGAPKVATGPTGAFQSHAMPHGNVRISIERPGYESLSCEVRVATETPKVLKRFNLFPLKKATRFLVAVTANKKPVLAKVRFVGDEPFVFFVSPKPEATSLSLPPGKYRIEVSSSGFQTQTREVQTAAFTEMALSFELLPMQPPPSQWVVVTETKIEILRPIHFETGTARIHADSFLLLKEVVEAILKNDIKKLRIEGHTDNQGGKARNLRLSLKRAKAVAQYLMASGVEASRLETDGLGDARPVAPNDTVENRELNRRVEFVILKR